jgi:hypothetical protein
MIVYDATVSHNNCRDKEPSTETDEARITYLHPLPLKDKLPLKFTVIANLDIITSYRAVPTYGSVISDKEPSAGYFNSSLNDNVLSDMNLLRIDLAVPVKLRALCDESTNRF